MSLIKQLWIGIIVIVLLAFGSSFFISAYQSKIYLAEQLQVKNIDNATGMALSLSQMEKDLTTIELMLSAQFDTGYYRRIALKDVAGNTLTEFTLSPQPVAVPDWFASLLAFNVKPGIAQIQDGWQRYGSIELESQTDYSLIALWQITQDLALGFLLIAIFCGVVGSFLLRRVSRPLNQVVNHAEALGNRQFITSEEPSTFELKRLVAAMNRLTSRVRSMLEQEQKQLDRLQKQHELDDVTGAFNRDYCANWLDSYFGNIEHSELSCVLLLRVSELHELNLQLGHAKTDLWLKQLVAEVQQYSGMRLVSRLNGSDFFLVVDQLASTAELTEQLLKQLNQNCKVSPSAVNAPVLLVGMSLDTVTSRQQTLAQLDALLVEVEASPPLQSKTLLDAKPYADLADATDWLKALQQAVTSGSISSTIYPVQRRDGRVMHQEAMLKMKIDGHWLSAAQVLGWARRYHYTSQLDIAMLKHALLLLQENKALNLALNISDLTLIDVATHYELLTLLQAVEPSIRVRLALEFDERLVVKQPLLFSRFAAALTSLSVHVGLQKCGFAINAIQDLEKLGIDYLKIDAALVRRYQNKDSAHLLSGLIKLAHTLSLTVIAEGVSASADIEGLLELGFDGLTGPAIV
ncbi:EAL domain-containing protein [Rheinheimera sp. UJ51]|uniref:bifunctional diguanylate cyclase/phosphodiesterase n=1 Tax=Rheinheimera sp. UJ51 TaxID=2892446 RepID=UPI001E3E1384|nr:LapD/MoxY N-terminal periplasmic domain-containing protein [Rheinheimera sp. UJ51]MCC5452854.1 EAL domain-containing protein [Rheinheimera sp. UJ51]